MSTSDPHRDLANLFSSADAAGDSSPEALLDAALGLRPVSLQRQGLTDSGNTIYRAELPSGDTVVLRVSPRRHAFAGTPHNLRALRGLGLPVQTVLGAGAVPSGGSFIVLDWLRGRDLVYELANMTHAQMTRVAEAIVECQRRVATLPEGDGFGWTAIGRRMETRRWTDLFGAPAPAAAAVGASVLDRLRARLRALRAQLEPYFAALRPVCFLDDLTTKNVLVEHGELQGLIDFDVVCYGDPLLAVGSTLAYLAADVGPAGRFYGDELVRCAQPQGDALRAVYFYGVLWLLGFVAAAEASGDMARARRLEPEAGAMLAAAEAV